VREVVQPIEERHRQFFERIGLSVQAGQIHSLKLPGSTFIPSHREIVLWGIKRHLASYHW
jgi:hypothetical protein